LITDETCCRDAGILKITLERDVPYVDNPLQGEEYRSFLKGHPEAELVSITVCSYSLLKLPPRKMTAFPKHLSQPLQVPWSIRDTWLGAACLGIWLLGAYAGVLLLKSLAVDISAGLLVALLELALLLPVWWLAGKKHGARWRDLGIRGFKARYLGLGLGLFFPAMWANALYEAFLSQYGLKMQPELERILAGTPSPSLFIFAAVIIAPAVEEIFFRGFLFAGLKKRFSWPQAMFISSGLFALLHLRPLAAPPIFLLGLVFAFLYQRSGSIWPAILIHALVNALAVTWILNQAAA